MTLAAVKDGKWASLPEATQRQTGGAETQKRDYTGRRNTEAAPLTTHSPRRQESQELSMRYQLSMQRCIQARP